MNRTFWKAHLAKTGVLPALIWLAAGAGWVSAQGFTPLATNPSKHSFEYVGRVDQAGDVASNYGYLTHIDGIDDALLFAAGIVPTTSQRSEVNARLTVVSKLTFTNRFVNGTMVIATQDESSTIYYIETPAPRDFAKPDTFSQGTAVATFHNRDQTILNVQSPISAQSPGRGILQATTESDQQSGAIFNLAGKDYALGQVGAKFWLFLTGQGTLTSSSPLAASFVVGGFAEEASRRPFRLF